MTKESNPAPDDDVPSPVPFDEGRIVTKRVRDKLEVIYERSPVRILGKDLLRSTALALDQAKRTTRDVSACRLALRLRRGPRFLSMVATASIGTDALFSRDQPHFDDVTKTPDHGQAARSKQQGPAAPDGSLKKKATRKHKQAISALQKVLLHLRSDEIASFVTFDEKSANQLQEEIERVGKEIKVPLGLRRGHPVVAESVMYFYDVFRGLTGTSLRGGRWDKQDQFLSELLFKFVRKITPTPITDEDVWSAIETAIKTKKPGKAK